MLEIHLKGTGIEKDRSKFIKKNNSWQNIDGQNTWQNIDRQNTWQNIDRQNTWQFFNNSCHQLIRTPLRSIENSYCGSALHFLIYILAMITSPQMWYSDFPFFVEIFEKLFLMHFFLFISIFNYFAIPLLRNFLTKYPNNNSFHF